jgi:hypothetical protein
LPRHIQDSAGELALIEPYSANLLSGSILRVESLYCTAAA